MIVVKAINRIISVEIVMISHGMRWALAMIRFMMKIMTLSYVQRLPSRINY